MFGAFTGGKTQLEQADGWRYILACGIFLTS